MCLIIAAFHVNPAYPLIIAANREERRARPSTPPHRWPDEPPSRPNSALRTPHSGLTLWAGRDETAGGTWLGVNAAGLVASITNRRRSPRAPVNPELPSRGLLCLEALRQPTPAAALQAAQATLQQSPSNPFNLFCANATEGWVLDWHGKHWRLTAGVHIVSNRGNPDDGRLGVVQRARALLADADLTCTSLDRLLIDLGHLCANTEGRHPLCRPGGDFGTVSSSLLALDPQGGIAAYHHANGPPCSVPYQPVETQMSPPPSAGRVRERGRPPPRGSG